MPIQLSYIIRYISYMNPSQHVWSFFPGSLVTCGRSDSYTMLKFINLKKNNWKSLFSFYVWHSARGQLLKGSFSCKRGFSLLNFERGLKKNYGLPNLESLCSYYSLLETATVLILCKNIESFLRYDCSKWDMLFSQR